MRAQTYEPSGGMGTMALVAGLVCGGAAAVLGAWLYQLLINLIPFIYVNFLLTLGFGFVISMAAAFGLALGKCRSVVAGAGVALVCGGLGVAASFYFDYGWKQDEALEELAELSPADDFESEELELLREWVEGWTFSDYVEFRVDTGWGLGASGSIELTGIFVWLAWLIEAAILCGVPLMVGAAVASDPFCEHCDEWTLEDRVGVTRAVTGGEQGKARRGGTIQSCLDVETGQGDRKLVWTFDECPRCDDTCFVTVTAMWTVSSGDKAEEKTEVLIEHVVPTQSEREAIQDHFDRQRKSGRP